jgi:bifunctional non-homologous end joining protein LigD
MPIRPRSRAGSKRTAPRRRPSLAAPRAIVRPMLATLVERPFDREGWIFEIKWDGYRAIADVEYGHVELYSRRHEPFNEKFAPIRDALAKFRHDAVLDGEIVVLDDEGKPSFQGLQNYQKSGHGQLAFYIFDLLSLDGQDLRHLPLVRRKEILRDLPLWGSRLRYCEHIETSGQAFFQALVAQDMEGMIAKKATSPYREGMRSYDWLKIKSRHQQEAVIAGFTKPRGGRVGFGALILGVYEDGALTYIGHTGGGFDTQTLLELHERLKKIATPQCPFTVRPKTNSPATWVRPEMVCEVAFHGWTGDGIMRQPIFLGMRTDKSPTQVHREEPAEVRRSSRRAARRKTEGDGA